MTIQPGVYGILNADDSLREIRTFTQTATVRDGRARTVTMTAQPAFNPATEKVIQNGWSVNPADVTPVWQIVNLTQAELDEIADQATIAQILAVADDMINGVGTTAQRQIRVETSLGRLVKRLAKTGTIP